MEESTGIFNLLHMHMLLLRDNELWIQLEEHAYTNETNRNYSELNVNVKIYTNANN